MDWDDPDLIATLDSEGYPVLEALTRAPFAVSSSHARPAAFLCVDGASYWVKGTAQQGLVAELIAGRLAHRLRVGPEARIIRVTPEACSGQPDLEHLHGVVVGSLGQQDCVNARDLQPLIGDGKFDPASIDASSRARVIVFQTWLGLGDGQVLVQLTTGKVFSIDHGDCFGDTSDLERLPLPIVTEIHGLDATVGRDREGVHDAVDEIEAITDEQLVESVSKVPSGDSWRSLVSRRLEIARWLAARRASLRQAMDEWLRS